MRGLVLFTALASALSLGVAGSAEGTDVQTRVRMLDPAPLTLRGVDFGRHELVRLTVSLGEKTAARKLRASDAGAFTARFPELRYGRCGPPLSVKAVGSRGSRVSWKLVPLACPEPAGS
jgi:hypothetical protein